MKTIGVVKLFLLVPLQKRTLGLDEEVEYTIVGSAEADPLSNLISMNRQLVELF